jgi:hypothetical protein
MRKMACALALVVVFVLALMAQEKNDKNPVASGIREIEQGRAKNMVAAAEEMPAEKYGFKATDGQMTFGHLALHIAGGNYVFCSKIGGVAEPKLAELKETDPKDKLVERMKQSFDFCATALGKLDDSNLSEVLSLFGETRATRGKAIIMLGGSWADHYSLQATYLRLNGLLPPTAKK